MNVCACLCICASVCVCVCGCVCACACACVCSGVCVEGQLPVNSGGDGRREQGNGCSGNTSGAKPSLTSALRDAGSSLDAPTVRRGYKRAFGSEESADVVLLTDVLSCIKGSLQTEESGSRFIGGSQHKMRNAFAGLNNCGSLVMGLSQTLVNSCALLC